MRSKHTLFERLNLKRLLPPGVGLVPMLLLTETCPFMPIAPSSPVTQVTVVADSASLAVGSETDVTATLRDADGNILNDRSVTWSVNDTAVATVLPSAPTSALVKGRATGPARVIAVAEGKSGAAEISVTSSTSTGTSLASVTVTLESTSLVVGSTTNATATLRDSLGNVLSGQSVFWSSNNLSAASVLATSPTTARVTAIGAGSAVIKAASESTIGTAGITVTAASSCLTSAGAWQNSSISSQTGSFEAQFDATPANANMDGVVGLSSGPAADYTGLAAIVRFNTQGAIDARNGGTYSAAAAIPYTAGATYHFRLDVDIPSHTYDMYVTPAGASEQLLGRGFFFRTEQAAVSALGNLSVYASLGSVTACNLVLSPWTPPPVASVTVSPASASVPIAQTLQLAATAKDANGNVLNGRTVTWASSALELATVSASGLVTGLALGAATITATSEGQTGSAAVTVAVNADTVPLYTLGNGKNYYASPSGSDANPCTAAAPCYTMQRVSQLMSPGDNAHFAPGEYRWDWASNRVTKSGTASAPITYISTEKWGAKVIGGCSPIGNDGDYVQIINFDVTGTCPQGITTNGHYSKVIGNRVHDLPGSSGGFAGILGDCCSYNRTGIQIIGNVVDNIGAFGQTNLIHGIYLGGPNGVIMNNIVTRASAACIDAWHGATNMIIANNTVANCGRYGIEIGADPALTVNRNSTVNNNIVVNVAGRGFHETNSSGGVFYNNIVYNNSPHFDLAGGTQAGTITLTSAQFSALFVNYTGDMRGDYRLRSGATAIDRGTTSCAAGVSLCVPLLDHVGISRPKGTAYDIGAFEQ